VAAPATPDLAGWTSSRGTRWRFTAAPGSEAPTRWSPRSGSDPRPLGDRLGSARGPEFSVAECRAVLAKHSVAAVRFRYAGDPYLLVVFRRDRLLGSGAPAAFPEESFLSGERDGKSFVFWERDGATFIAVSEADVTRTFEMVRLCFS
jgi:hypothetical protein